MNYRDIFEVTDTYIHGFFENYRFLSNFHLCNIYYNGVLYPSTENAYQASKYGDIGLIAEFSKCSPKESKQLSKANILSPEDIVKWDNKKLRIMMEINSIKYTHKNLRELLISTGYRYLEETNYWKDTFWGVCNGKGHNYLGKIIMNIRDYWISNIEIDDTIKQKKKIIYKMIYYLNYN